MQFRKRMPPIGARPGSLAIAADASAPRLRAFRFDVDSVDERDIEEPAGVRALLDEGGVLWLDVQGLGDEAVLRELGEIFGIHALALEDVVNAPQRPKSEPYDEHDLLITRMVQLVEDGRLVQEQIAILVGRGYVVTFQERYGDNLDPIRTRIREGVGRIRTSGADYLGYAILDTIIDGYYPVIEGLGEIVEAMEERVMVDATPTTLRELNGLRNELVGLRRILWPQRNSLNALVRDPQKYIGDDVRMYLRDTYDHTAQVLDVLDSYREVVNGLTNMYLSVVSNRMNEIMKVLTIMASIFIPLTFMAGIYGMNFESMPELHVAWAYPALLVSMVVVAAAMLLYFRRKGWIGKRPDDG